MNRTFKAFYLVTVFILFGLGMLVVAQVLIEGEKQEQECARELERERAELFMEQEVVIEPNEPNEVE